MDVQGWITLTNNSGTPYVNANTLLVAGAVGQDNQRYARLSAAAAAAARHAPGRAPRPRAASGSATSISIRCPSGPRSPTPRPSRSASSTSPAAPAARAYEYRNAWLGTLDQPASANTCCASPRRAPAGLAMRCRPARSASISATRAASRSSSAKARSATRRWARTLGLATGQAFDIKVQPIVEKRERVISDGSRWRTTMRYTSDQRPPARRSPSTSSSRACGATRGSSTKASRASAARADEARVAGRRPGQWRGDRHRHLRHPLLRRARCVCSLCIAADTAAPRLRRQAVVTSPRPDAVAVTVYRDPDRGPADAFNLNWLGGYALISETRRVRLPAGESEIRFEGVAGGIIPQSAIVTGLPERHRRDATATPCCCRPAICSTARSARRVHLRRTSRATGEVVEQEAVIRSGADGAVVLQTSDGIEALRCAGQSETLIVRRGAARPVGQADPVGPHPQRANRSRPR